MVCFQSIVSIKSFICVDKRHCNCFQLSLLKHLNIYIFLPYSLLRCYLFICCGNLLNVQNKFILHYYSVIDETSVEALRQKMPITYALPSACLSICHAITDLKNYPISLKLSNICVRGIPKILYISALNLNKFVNKFVIIKK